MQFYNAEDVMELLNVGRSKAYKVIRELADELVNEGYHRPPNGRIQKKRFCEKFLFDIAECDNALEQLRGA